MRALIRDVYLRVFGTLRQPVKGVHIINSHHVTPATPGQENARIMHEFLAHLNQFATFISLPEAVNKIKDKQTDDAVYMTFTYDDGFEECYDYIAPALEAFNTRGTFFINANYPELDMEYREGFNERVVTFTKNPMNWEQIKSLHQRGHLIGSHTLDHFNLAELDDNEIDFQLRENKQILEQKLNYQCEHFAWTYGGMQHFPDNALKIAMNYHKYIYSGTDFKHYFSRDKKVLNRRHLEADWPKSHLDYFLSHKRT